MLLSWWQSCLLMNYEMLLTNGLLPCQKLLSSKFASPKTLQMLQSLTSRIVETICGSGELLIPCTFVVEYFEVLLAILVQTFRCRGFESALTVDMSSSTQAWLPALQQQANKPHINWRHDRPEKWWEHWCSVGNVMKKIHVYFEMIAEANNYALLHFPESSPASILTARFISSNWWKGPRGTVVGPCHIYSKLAWER